jgi:hypothetical protein
MVFAFNDLRTIHGYGPGELGSTCADDNDSAWTLDRHLGLKVAAAAVLEVERFKVIL